MDDRNDRQIGGPEIGYSRSGALRAGTVCRAIGELACDVAESAAQYTRERSAALGFHVRRCADALADYLDAIGV